MSISVVDVSRDFFDEVVKPMLEHKCPEETAQTAFGVFGYGSEVLRLDDDYSQDHHWGLRINALMPDDLSQRAVRRSSRRSTPTCPPPIEGIRCARG